MPTVTIGSATSTQHNCDTPSVNEISALRKNANAITSGKNRTVSSDQPYGTRNSSGHTFANGVMLKFSCTGM